MKSRKRQPPTPPPPRIGVGLLTCDRPVESAFTMMSLLQQTELPDVIVVLENSRHGNSFWRQNVIWGNLAEAATFRGVRVVFESVYPKLNMAEGRRHLHRLLLGFPLSMHMLCDDDVVTAPPYIAEAKRMLQSGFDVVCGAAAVFLGQGLTDPARFEKDTMTSTTFNGGAICYNRTTATNAAMEIMPERTPNLGEDQIFIREARRRGAKVGWVPAPVLHLTDHSDSKYSGGLTIAALSDSISDTADRKETP